MRSSRDTLEEKVYIPSNIKFSEELFKLLLLLFILKLVLRYRFHIFLEIIKEKIKNLNE